MDKRLDAIKIISGNETDEEKLECMLTYNIYKIADNLKVIYKECTGQDSLRDDWVRGVILSIHLLTDITFTFSANNKLFSYVMECIHFDNNMIAPRVDIAYNGKTVSLVGDASCYYDMNFLIVDKLEAIIDKCNTIIEQEINHL